MAKKPIKKDKQEANIEDQIDNEILNQEAVGDLKSNNNILKYSMIIIFSLICGGIITLSSDNPFNLSGNGLDKLGHIGDKGETEFGTDDNSSGNSNSGSLSVAREE